MGSKRQTNKQRDSKQKTLTDIDRKRGTCRQNAMTKK